MIIGSALVLLGLASLYGHITKNEKFFWKKDRMKKFWGEKLGTIIHFVGYVIAPIAFGIFMLIKEFL